MVRYAVTIYYREPSFEQRLGRQGEPFRFTFVVLARSKAGAILQARQQFEEMARLSSVAWVRDIVRIEVSC